MIVKCKQEPLAFLLNWRSRGHSLKKLKSKTYTKISEFQSTHSWKNDFFGKKITGLTEAVIQSSSAKILKHFSKSERNIYDEVVFSKVAS